MGGNKTQIVARFIPNEANAQKSLGQKSQVAPAKRSNPSQNHTNRPALAPPEYLTSLSAQFGYSKAYFFLSLTLSLTSLLYILGAFPLVSPPPPRCACYGLSPVTGLSIYSESGLIWRPAAFS